MADNADIAGDYMDRLTENRLQARVRYRGASRTHCVECEEPIPQRRQDSLPGVQRCVSCQELRERG
jgi:phage/conjugal plasmid C-4 type zinc finger TraR family protein